MFSIELTKLLIDWNLRLHTWKGEQTNMYITVSIANNLHLLDYYKINEIFADYLEDYFWFKKPFYNTV